MKPRIIKAITSNTGKIIKETKPEIIRRVISEETAITLKTFLVGAVEHGTGLNARLKNFKIAGKTGTAQKPFTDRKGYSRTDVIASFAGFWPADDPQFVCLVLIDTPRNGHYGGTVAAPVFRNIVQRISNVPINKPKIVWDNNQDGYKPHKKNRIPDVRNLSVKFAKNKLKKFSDFVDISGAGAIVISQKPLPGKYLKNGERIILTCADNPLKAEKNVTIPNLIGFSMRKAINNIQLINLKFKVTYGSGEVVEQAPKPGKKVKPGSVCYIRFSNNEKILKTLAYK